MFPFDDVIILTPLQQRVIEVHSGDFVCIPSSRPAIVGVGTLAGLLVLLMALVLVVYKFRGEIKIILYFKLGWKPFDRSDDSDILDKVGNRSTWLSFLHNNKLQNSIPYASQAAVVELCM